MKMKKGGPTFTYYLRFAGELAETNVTPAGRTKAEALATMKTLALARHESVYLWRHRRERRPDDDRIIARASFLSPEASNVTIAHFDVK